MIDLRLELVFYNMRDYTCVSTYQSPPPMKRLFAIVALLLMISAPLAQTASAEKGGGSTTNCPAGDILD